MLSATTETQPAFEYDKVGHGYFTYYLLLGLKGKADKDNNRWIDLVGIYNFINELSNLANIKLGKYK